MAKSAPVGRFAFLTAVTGPFSIALSIHVRYGELIKIEQTRANINAYLLLATLTLGAGRLTVRGLLGTLAHCGLALRYCRGASHLDDGTWSRGHQGH